MPRFLIVLAALLAMLTGCATGSAKRPSVLIPSTLAVVRLVVWNNTDQTPEVSVSLDEEMIYKAVVRTTIMAPSIVAQQEHKIPAGMHHVVVYDQTRRIRREAELKLDDVANIHVVIRPNDTVLFITFDKNPGYQ